MERVAIYPGSFDPLHYGHVDIAQRAARLFDRLIVAVYDRPSKKLLFSTAERVAMAQSVLGGDANIEVRPYHSLTVAFAEVVGAQVLVRGLRVISDFELEYQMALTNNQLAPDIETICLMTRHEYAFLTASIVKEVFWLGGDSTSLVPPLVFAELQRKRATLPDDTGPFTAVSIRD